MYFLYSLLLALGLVIALPFWVFQAVRHGKYRRGFGERLGRVPERLRQNLSQPVIWIHAVSVGEVLAISQLVAQLHKELPGYRVVVSTTTDTAQKLARQRFGEANVFHFPLDFGFSVTPYLRLLNPALVVPAETELWPNFLRLCKKQGAKIAVVNARISDRSWPGYRRWRWLLVRILRNVDLFLAQTEEDRRRLIDIGASGDRVSVSGNLKFDIPAPAIPEIVSRLSQVLTNSNAGPVLVAGSTVDSEEEGLLLAAFRNAHLNHPSAVMILAPRHPERFQQAANFLRDFGVPYVRRTEWDGGPIAGKVFLLDSIGELGPAYSLADVAFVGGSLVPRGGHNIIEPAQYGVPILVGNYTHNFRDIINLFHGRDALKIVGPAELPLVLMELFSHPEERKELGRKAKETLQTQMGATERTVIALKGLLASQAASVDRS